MRPSSYLTLETRLDDSVRRARKFELQGVEGEENLCGDFSYRLEVCCPERLTEEEIEQLIGNNITACIGFSLNGQPACRHINGMVYRIYERGMSRAPLVPNIWQYRLEISSWLRQLSFAKECRIFQKNNQTNLGIVTDLLTELGLRDFRSHIRRTLIPKSYVTIYNETYYDFIVRLLQEEGIIWRFEHSPKGHILVFDDDSENLPELPAASWSSSDGFKSFCRRNAYKPIDGCQLTDYDYDNPPEKRVGKPGKSPYRYFEYPGNFITRAEGEDKSARLSAGLKNDELVFEGSSTIRRLEAGKKFKLEAKTLPEVHDRPFIITRLHIEAGPEKYLNSFTVIPTQTPFFFPFKERIVKPRILGNQTAVVVGRKNAAGSHIDNQGRILVRFHWDRHSPENTGSAFIRNVMPAAGARRGFVFNPQVDDEVVVAFENGDPDRPLVIGRVYSSTQQLPESPANNPDRSVIRSSNARDSNHVLFDDQNDAENLEFKAKKDMNINVGTDLNVEINNDLTILADNLEITANGNILTGNIITLSGGSIKSIAGTSISNTTGLMVANLTGGLATAKAGANGVNAALGMVDSKSGGHTLSAAPLIFNTTAGSIEQNGQNGVKNLGLVVANTALELIDNSAGKMLRQKADLAILTKTKTESNTFDKASSTEALLIKDKGEMVINDG